MTSRIRCRENKTPWALRRSYGEPPKVMTFSSIKFNPTLHPLTLTKTQNLLIKEQTLILHFLLLRSISCKGHERRHIDAWLKANAAELPLKEGNTQYCQQLSTSIMGERKRSKCHLEKGVRGGIGRENVSCNASLRDTVCSPEVRFVKILKKFLDGCFFALALNPNVLEGNTITCVNMGKNVIPFPTSCSTTYNRTALKFNQCHIRGGIFWRGFYYVTQQKPIANFIVTNCMETEVSLLYWLGPTFLY